MFPSFTKQFSHSQHLLAWILCLLIPLFLRVECNTECVWATGRIICNKNQSKVLGAIVELWDLDSPQNSKVKNPADPDDKAGFTVVNEESGLFQVEGCASDHDWLPGIVNRPEFYLRVHHECNTQFGEFMTILPIFRVYTPNTYDYHIQQPIVLDTPTAPRLNGSTAANGIGGVGNFGSTIPNNRSFVELNDAEEDNQD